MCDVTFNDNSEFFMCVERVYSAISTNFNPSMDHVHTCPITIGAIRTYAASNNVAFIHFNAVSMVSCSLST